MDEPGQTAGTAPLGLAFMLISDQTTVIFAGSAQGAVLRNIGPGLTG